MLVLTRRLHDKIVIPGLDVTIQVVAVKGGTVRIGIEAPPEVPILRGELLDQSQGSGCEAQTDSRQLCYA